MFRRLTRCSSLAVLATQVSRRRCFTSASDNPRASIASAEAHGDETLSRWAITNLPQRLSGGAFECQYCSERTVHLTRDRLLVHISEHHPNVDLDAVETHLPARVTGVAVAAAPQRLPSVVPIPPPRSAAVAQKLHDVVFRDDCFPCELCGKEFGTEFNLLQHLESSHPDGTADGPVEVSVEKSKAGDPEETMLRRLMAVETKIRNAADASVAHPPPAADPLLNVQGVSAISVVCDLCGTGQGKVFTSVSALFAHIKSKHLQHSAADHTRRMIREQQSSVQLSFTCPECRKAFRTADALANHRLKHAAGLSGPAAPVALNQAWWCHECERGFGSPQALHGHLTTKHGLPSAPFPCPACKRIFPDVYSLKTHISLAHKTIDPAEIKGEDHSSCPECMRQFIGAGVLELHWKKHHQQRVGDMPKHEVPGPRVVKRAVSTKRITESAEEQLCAALTHDITAEAVDNSGGGPSSVSEEPPSTPSETATQEEPVEPPKARVVVRRKARIEEEAEESIL
jgi:hypothetical protein